MKSCLLSVGSLYVVSSTRSAPDQDGKSSNSDGEDVAESPASEYFHSSKGYKRIEAMHERQRH